MTGFWVVAGLVILAPVAIIWLADPAETQRRDWKEIEEARWIACAPPSCLPAQRVIDDFASSVTALPVDAPVAQRFGEIKAVLRHQGNLIEDFDLLLAATALVHGLTLITNTTAYFDRIAGSTIDNWAQP